jgi:hypothetical protein
VKTARQVIAEAMDDEKMMYDSDEANADQIIAALHAAGYVIIKDRTDPEGENMVPAWWNLR